MFDCLEMTVEVYLADQPAPHVFVRGAGHVSAENLTKMFEDAMALSFAHRNFKIFADLSEMDAGHSLADLYWIVRELEEREVPRREFREAIFVRSLEGASEQVEFFELAARNRGYEVRLFESRSAAMTWLWPAEATAAPHPTHPADGRGT